MQRHTIHLAAAVATLAGTLAAAPAEAAPSAGHSTGDIAWFADPATPVGTSRVTRTPNGVTATFRTSGLAPKETVTMWWVVFNDPDGCSDACGEDDIFVDGDPAQGIDLDGVAAADIVVGYAAGTVANARGEAMMAGHLGVGEAGDDVLFGTTPVLKDSRTAEIHLVARSHGPAVPGLVDDQTGSYGGGCEVLLLPPAVPDEVGECADIQFAVHLP